MAADVRSRPVSQQIGTRKRLLGRNNSLESYYEPETVKNSRDLNFDLTKVAVPNDQIDGSN